MKLPTRRSGRKKSFILIGIALGVIALGGLAFLFLRSQTAIHTTSQSDTAPTNTVNYNPPTAEEQANQEQQKKELLEQTNAPPQPDPALGITISRADQASSGQPLNLRTIVNGATSGSCAATFTKGSNTVTKSFAIAQSQGSYICNGDIEAGAFAEAGEWNLSVVIKSGGQTSAPATQKVVIAL